MHRRYLIILAEVSSHVAFSLSESLIAASLFFFVLRLGLIGDEFRNTRKHLMKRMPGSAAWKYGRPAAR